jgi:hypothetical protein
VLGLSLQVNSYAPYTYDATYAIAHALHHLIEVRGVTSIVGAELMDALILNVSFPGVTGTIELFDGSANPDRQYHGDRRVGVAYDVLNFQSAVAGLVRVARWTPAADSTFTQRWAQSSSFVFSTLDNSIPLDVVIPSCPSNHVVSGGQCVVCPAGTYHSAVVGTAAVCEPCPAATYEVNHQCQACVSFASSQTQLTRSFGGAEYYADVALCALIKCAQPNGVVCGLRESCCPMDLPNVFDDAGAKPLRTRILCAQPDGVVCGSGTHLATWTLEPGRWRLSPSSTDILRCEREASNDGSSRCIGGTIEAQGSSDDLCMEGHAGPMCMLCVATNESQHASYFDRAKRRCTDCPSDTGARTGALVGAAAGIVLLVYVLGWSWRRGLWCSWWKKEAKDTSRCQKLLRKMILFVKVVIKVMDRTATPRFKILIAFYQAVILLPDLYGIEMPSDYCEASPPCRNATARCFCCFCWWWCCMCMLCMCADDALHCVHSDHSLDWLQVLKFDWSDFVVPGACLVGGLKFRLVLRGLVPLLLMLSPLVFCIVQYVISHCRARMATRNDLAIAPVGQSFKDAVFRALPAVIFISFCLVQTVSTGIFSAWGIATGRRILAFSHALLRDLRSSPCGYRLS